LIGAPPGYIGYEEGGQLTEAVRRKPYSVILFDEIEKAHPQVFNLFLQIFDDGRLTDSKGITVDFRNTIIIATSNLGSEIIRRKTGENNGTIEKELNELLHTAFKPEFLNRLDGVVVYDSLNEEDLKKIAKLQLEDVKARLSENNINLEAGGELIDYFAKNGYDPVFGARPLKRLIDEKLVDEIAIQIIGEKIKPGDTVVPRIKGENIIV
jgi:ATP-dependent Clp protease ATP-binding subunit ClpB